jgi:hypothetical protein
MLIRLEQDFNGIVFGFELSFIDRRFTFAFLFWGLTFILNK